MEIATIRQDLIGSDTLIPSSIGYLDCDEHATTKFWCMPMQAHEEEKGVMVECYNLLLKHPVTHELFWAYNIDFDFETQEGE